MLKFVVENRDVGRAKANQVMTMAWGKDITLGGQYFFILFSEVFSLIYCICFALCTYKASSGENAIMVSCLQ